MADQLESKKRIYAQMLEMAKKLGAEDLKQRYGSADMGKPGELEPEAACASCGGEGCNECGGTQNHEEE